MISSPVMSVTLLTVKPIPDCNQLLRTAFARKIPPVSNCLDIHNLAVHPKTANLLKQNKYIITKQNKL